MCSIYIINTNEELIKNLYYDPNNAFTSIKKLYDNLKQRGVTRDEIKKIIPSQEVEQLF